MIADPTRIHLRALRMVRNGEVAWRQASLLDGVPRRSAGFASADGTRLSLKMLVALWELKHDRLIVVDETRVSLTLSGHDCLSEWNPTKAGT